MSEYAIRIESGAGSGNGDVVGTCGSLTEARDAVDYMQSAWARDLRLAIYRLELVEEDDDE